MQLSAPTTASHALSTAPVDRDTKRRKMVQHQVHVADNTMMDATNAVANGAMVTDNNNNITCNNAMEIDSQPSTASSSNSSNLSNYAHPSSSNLFNGNALSDEELVYQVDFMSSCPPSDFVM